MNTPQNYPRIEDEDNPLNGCLDDTVLAPHLYKVTDEKIRQIILLSIEKAEGKSRRESLNIPLEAADDEIILAYKKEGKKLFQYFKQYCGDPAASAHQIFGKKFEIVGVEQFRNRALQKERMNSGWRYQFFVLDCAQATGRFKNISDIGTAEADFNAVIEFIDKSKSPLNLYVSVKNRKNTLGGQDWPKAIHALEEIAKKDKNRIGPYCCVFGIAMDHGSRYIKVNQKTNTAHSINTEIWLSDFFWPFFTNLAYEEVMKRFLEVLLSTQKAIQLPTEISVPQEVLASFGVECRKADLLDEDGNFNDPFKLVQFFCDK